MTSAFGQTLQTEHRSNPSMDHVYAKVADELQRRKDHRLAGSTWLWLCRELGLGKQNATGWTSRGTIPPKHYAAIAALFGWSLDDMLSIDRAPRVSGAPDLEKPQTEQAPPLLQPLTNKQGVAVTHIARVAPDGGMELFDAAPGRFVAGIDGSPRAYALIAQGDALMPYIRHGQAVVIDPAVPCDSGDMVLVALRSGRVMVRELLSLGDVVRVAHPVSGVRDGFDALDVARVHHVQGVMSQRAVIRVAEGP